MEALEARAAREPNNPEAHYTIATYYWDKAYSRLQPLRRPTRSSTQSPGIAAVDKALAINKDYMDALIYKNLLLRPQA